MNSILPASQGTGSLWPVVLVLALVSRSFASDVNYCSNQNTASDFQAVYNQYQSNGACHDTCTGRYAMAVLSGSQCWCADYAPSQVVSTSLCDVACPGFGYEWCGNSSAGLYAYILIDGATPRGTIGAASSTVAASSSASSSSSSLSSSISSSVVVPFSMTTKTSSEPAPSSPLASSASPTLSSVSSSSVALKSSSSSSISSTLPSTTPTPTEIYTSIITVTGQVRTILVTPTTTPDSTLGSTSSAGSGGGGGVRPGTVVGIVVGVALGLGLLIGLGVWYWLRRRHQRAADLDSLDRNSAGGGNNGVPSRQVSQMSSAGLLSKGTLITTAGLPPGSGPKSAQSASFNRQSLGTDQRLNPYAIYAQEESRNSNVSLQDNQDYSRQLRVANPDP